MARFPSVLAAVLLASCATTQTAESLKLECEADPTRDERCIALLTGGPAHYESREEVLKKEASREDDAFQSQLERLRRAEEERQKVRFQQALSSTAAVTQVDPAPADDEAIDDDALAEEARRAGVVEEDSASSVRAIRQARPDEKPEVHDVSEAKRPDPKPVKQPEPPARLITDAPTPEHYLRAAVCLAGGDLPAMKAGLLAEKRKPAKQRPDQAALGAHALVLVEADGVVGSVADELRHRGLPEQKVDAKCTAKPLAEVVQLLRSLVGPVLRDSRDAERYGRGLVRLRTELETRAGLPKAP